MKQPKNWIQAEEDHKGNVSAFIYEEDGGTTKWIRIATGTTEQSAILAAQRRLESLIQMIENKLKETP